MSPDLQWKGGYRCVTDGHVAAQFQPVAHEKHKSNWCAYLQCDVNGALVLVKSGDFSPDCAEAVRTKLEQNLVHIVVQ